MGCNQWEVKNVLEWSAFFLKFETSLLFVESGGMNRTFLPL